MNNLLERLHASFFFYILTSPTQFLKIGSYLPSAILISIAMMIHGLGSWVDAAWFHGEIIVLDDKEEKSPVKAKWRRRKRPLIGVLSIMIATHLFGAVLFAIACSPFFIRNYDVGSAEFFCPLILTLHP